jgi:DNA-binding transcriptional LysR family regulator
MEFLSRATRYFLVVTETGSLSLASKTLRVGQPALSVAMSQLEAELGTKLFMKEGRRLALTARGQQLAEALRESDRYLSQRITKALSHPDIQVIRFGVVNHWAKQILVKDFSKISQKFGSLQVHMGYSLKILEQVRSGELDFGIITWAIREPKWAHCTVIGNDPTGVVGLKGKFDHIKKAKSISDLAGESWIWHRMPQKNVSEYLKPHETGFVVDDYDVMKELLLSGQGIADVQLASFSKAELSKLVVAPLSHYSGSSQVKIYLVFNDGLSERHQELMSVLKGKIQREI